MDEQQTTVTQGGASRGPGYPFIALDIALERARQFQDVAGRNPAPLNAASEAWGFSDKSSNNQKTAAALKRYGLAEDVGEGKVRLLRLTDFGRELLFHEADRANPRWQEMIREAALKPNIFSDLWEQFGSDVPSDRVIQHHLDFVMGLSPDAARDAVKKWRATMDFAGVRPDLPEPSAAGGAHDRSEAAAAELTVHSEDAFTSGSSVGARAAGLAEPVQPADDRRAALPTAPVPSQADSRKSITIPYSADRWAALQADFPITPEEWDAMMVMLGAMKPGLTLPALTPQLALDAAADDDVDLEVVDDF